MPFKGQPKKLHPLQQFKVNNWVNGRFYFFSVAWNVWLTVHVYMMGIYALLLFHHCAVLPYYVKR